VFGQATLIQESAEEEPTLFLTFSVAEVRAKMFWLFPLWAQVSLGLWVGALGLLYYFFTLHFNHWQKKGVKFEKGYPLVGSLAGAMTMREHLLTAFDKMYKKYQGERFVGFYQGRKPALLILDPELIKKILVKDFSYFYDHGFKVCLYF